MFFLSSSSYLWYLFSRIRAMIESNRGRFMYLHSCCCFGVVVVVVVLRSSSFTCSEKKGMTREKNKIFFFGFLLRKKRKSALLVRVFSIFSLMSSVHEKANEVAISSRGIVA